MPRNTAPSDWPRHAAVATVDLQAAATARLRDARLRPPVRSQLPKVDRLVELGRAGAGSGAQTIEETVVDLLDPVAEVYKGLVLGTRDYVTQERLRARSSSASPAGSTRRSWPLIAADALGPDRVTAVVMPSRYSSEGTQSDARCPGRQPRGSRASTIPIEPAVEVYEADARGGLQGS